MKNKLTIVKLGGNCMNDEDLMSAFLQSFSSLSGLKILVHGGGKLASQLSEKLNIPAQMIEGRRITDAHTLDVVTMVYAGLINKKIVAGLQKTKCNAIGLSGVDGNLITSKKRATEPIDYGYVGDPIDVNATLLLSLIQNNYVPVIAPITHDLSGQLLNTNADTIASILAVALSEHYDVHLLFAFDKRGVLSDSNDDNSVIELLSKTQFMKMKSSGVFHSGILPKLNAGFAAVENNVGRVSLQHITSLDMNSISTQLLS